MVKLRVATGDGADAPLMKFGTIKKSVFNAIAKLTKSAKGGGFLRDVVKEVGKVVVGSYERMRGSCKDAISNFCLEGVVERKMRLDSSTVRYSAGNMKDTEHQRTQMSYLYYIPKSKKGPQSQKAGPPKAPTSQGPRKDKRDQAGPALRQKDPGPSTSGLRGLRRSNRGKSGKAGSMGSSSGSGSSQGRPTMRPLIPRLSPRAVNRIIRRQGLAPGVSGAVVNQGSVAPDTTSDSGSIAQLDHSKEGRGYGKEPAGSPDPPMIHSGRRGTAVTAASQSPAIDTTPAANQIAQLDHSKEGRGYGKEPAGSPDPPMIHSGRRGTAVTAASQSPAIDTTPAANQIAQLDHSKEGRGYGKEPAGSPDPPMIHSGRRGTAVTAASQSPAVDTTPAANQIAQQEGGQLQLDDEEIGEIATTQQPLSPLGNTLATLQREHKNAAALEEEIVSIFGDCEDAKTAVECAEREKKNILEQIRATTESAEKLPRFTDGAKLSQATYEKTISGFRNAHAKARRLESELASLRKQETAKKVALGNELKKLETEIESLESRLQKEMDAAKASKRELDNCPMMSEKFGAINKQFQKQWGILEETQGERSLKDNELTAAKTQAQATENGLATSISTAEEDLDVAVSLYRDLTAQLLTGRARSLQSIGDPRVSTGAPSPGQSYGTPIQHEKLANDLFLQHEMETKAAKAAEALGKNLQEKRKAIAAAEEKFANTLERVKMYLGDLPRPPVSSLGTLAMEERSRILRLMIAQEKAMTAVHLELYRLPTQLDEQKKANEKVIQETKGRVDAQRMKVQEAGNQMHKLAADLFSSGDEDRSMDMEIGHQICGQTAALVKAKTELAAAEAELKAAERDGEMAANRTQRKIGDMESVLDTDRTRLCELVARLYAGTGIGNPGYVQPVAGGRTGSPRDGTGVVGPDAGAFPVGSANLEENTGNVGTDAGRDPAGTPSGNTQDGTGEVGSDAEMEQVETPTRDGSMEPVTPGSVGLRSEGSLTPSPRGGRDNHEQADSSSTEDPEVGALMSYYPSTYNYAPNYDFSDEDEHDFFALLPQDLMEEPAEEDGGPSCSGLGDRSPSTGIGCLDADAGSSTAGYSGMSSASQGPQDDPEDMDTE